MKTPAKTDNKAALNYERYLERINFYRSFGYDLEKEREILLDKSLPVSGKILEIGTGKGHFALALAKRGSYFVSIDISASSQQIAEMNLRHLGLKKYADLRIMDARNMDFPGESFDVVFSVNVFHHLERPSEVLGEVIRVLKPGGRVILSDFNARGMRLINACHSYEGHNHDFSRQGLSRAADYLSRRNFQIKQYESEAQ
ncbi:MAG: class I SAM-dependent methyltransferase, partial [Candidatus Omnitrophica bacterium]|nr:class I SAM-dependent methyltransferase [Candidatus Omnitrophota bacterium]